MSSTDFTIVAEGLTRRFGDQVALAEFDLKVPAGTVRGLLGPNGAGKTTAVRILTTLLRPSAGRALVAGFDVTGQAAAVRSRIGLIGQATAVDEILTARENLIMFGRLAHLGGAVVRRRAGELLERFGLTEAAGTQVKRYSGGMRRRLDFAIAMLRSPAILFLDEPTTGLDPRARNEVWDAIRGLVAGRTTVVLTTQYLDEADQLSDAITIIDRGRVIAEGSPDRLKSELGGDRIDVVLRDPARLGDAAAIVAGATGCMPALDPDRRRVSAAARDRLATLTAVVRELDGSGIAAEDLAIRRPTLDDVFLHLTGQEAARAERREVKA